MMVNERLSLIGGAAEVRSTPGSGTVVKLTAPLGAEAPPEGAQGK